MTGAFVGRDRDVAEMAAGLEDALVEHLVQQAVERSPLCLRVFW